MGEGDFEPELDILLECALSLPLRQRVSRFRLHQVVLYKIPKLAARIQSFTINSYIPQPRLRCRPGGVWAD